MLDEFAVNVLNRRQSNGRKLINNSKRKLRIMQEFVEYKCCTRLWIMIVLKALPMNDIETVAIFDSFNNVTKYLFCTVFFEPLVGHDVIEKLSSVNILENHI